MRPSEVMDLLSISRKTLYRLISTKEIPAVRIGGQWRFEPEAIEHFMVSDRMQSWIEEEEEWGERIHEPS